MGFRKRLMAVGDFEVVLRPEAPQTMREAMLEWGHIIVTDVEVDPIAFGDAAMKGASIFTGIVTEVRRALGGETRVLGPHISAHLGDGTRGDILEAKVTFASATSMPAIVTSLLPAGGSIIEGTIGSVTGTYTGTHIYETPAQAIKTALTVGFAAEYRVNDDGTLDADLPGTLFVGTPKALIARVSGTYDPGPVKGVPTSAMDTSLDSRDLTTKVIHFGKTIRNDTVVGTATVASNPFKDFFGNALVRKAIFSDSTVGPNRIDGFATAALDSIDQVVNELSVTLDDNFDVEGYFDVGDEIYVYDPDQRLFDTTNQTTFRGEIVFPEQIRVIGLQRPLQSGMGVYYRDLDGVYTNISRYVQWEGRSAGTIVEVGSLPPSFGDADAVSQELASFKSNFTGSGSPGNDTSAYHDNVSGEKSATTDATIAVGDIIIFDDVSNANAPRRDTVQGIVDLSGGGAGSDTDAIHNNVAAEISAVTAITAVKEDDKLLAEDQSDSDNKKSVIMSDVSQGYVKLATWTYASDVTSITFSGISAGYQDLMLEFQNVHSDRTGGANDYFDTPVFQWGATTVSAAAEYNRAGRQHGDSAGNTEAGNQTSWIPFTGGGGGLFGTDADASAKGLWRCIIEEYSQTRAMKKLFFTGIGRASGTKVRSHDIHGLWLNAAVIDIITITPNNGSNFTAGTIRLYGLKHRNWDKE